MKSVVKAMREEPNQALKMLTALMGFRPTTMEALIVGYLSAPHITPEGIVELVKLGLVRRAGPKVLATLPEAARELMAEFLCKEFRDALDRFDGEALERWGKFLSAQRERLKQGTTDPRRDSTRAFMLSLKLKGVALTKTDFLKCSGYKTDRSNLDNMAAEYNYHFAPGRRGRPAKVGN